MAESTALIEAVESAEKRYNSVVDAPEIVIENIQQIAQKLPKSNCILHPNTYVRLSTNPNPRITSDYRVLRGWRKLCFGANLGKLAKELHITPTSLAHLRSYQYEYVFKSHGKTHQFRAKYIDTLVKRLNLKGINAPRSNGAFERALHAYDQGMSNKYAGYCRKLCIMRRLVFRTKGGDYRATIPVSLRRHA